MKILLAVLIASYQLASQTSYSNPGGTGMRLGLITLNGSTAFQYSNLTYWLINGDTTSNGYEFNGAGNSAGEFIVFDFGLDAYVIDEAKWYQSTTTTHGVWQWQGSNDGSTWTNVGTTFTLGGFTPSQTITALNGNVIAYKQYKLLGISGTRSTSPWIYEIEFKISPIVGSTRNTSYYNRLGRGDRTIPVTTSYLSDLFISIATAAATINGVYDNGAYFHRDTATGDWLEWDLGAPKIIDEAAWFWNVPHSYGIWQWQGSTNNSTWVNIGATVDIGGTVAAVYDPSQRMTVLNGNTTAYRYYRILCVTGGTYNAPTYIQEVEFHIGDGTSSVSSIRAADSVTYAPAASVTVVIPSGALVGDTALMQVAMWGPFTPPGWTQMYIVTGTIWDWVVCWKVLTAADITAGSVTMVAGGTFNAASNIVVFSGTVAFREIVTSYTASVNFVTSSAVVNTDLGIGFGSQRQLSVSPTFTPGTVLDSAVNSSFNAAVYSVPMANGVNTVVTNGGASANWAGALVVVKGQIAPIVPRHSAVVIQ